jgi:hypothetical protein
MSLGTIFHLNGRIKPLQDDLGRSEGHFKCYGTFWTTQYVFIFCAQNIDLKTINLFIFLYTYNPTRLPLRIRLGTILHLIGRIKPLQDDLGRSEGYFKCYRTTCVTDVFTAIISI